MLDNEKYLLGSEQYAIEGRIILFCSLKTKPEYRLLSNISISDQRFINKHPSYIKWFRRIAYS